MRLFQWNAGSVTILNENNSVNWISLQLTLDRDLVFVIFSWVKRIDMLYWVLTISCNSTLPVSCVCWATLFGTQEHRCIGIQSCCFGGDLSNKKKWISWVKFFYLEDIYRFDAWCLNSKISAKAIGKTEC